MLRHTLILVDLINKRLDGGILYDNGSLSVLILSSHVDVLIVQDACCERECCVPCR